MEKSLLEEPACSIGNAPKVSLSSGSSCCPTNNNNNNNNNNKLTEVLSVPAVNPGIMATSGNPTHLPGKLIQLYPSRLNLTDTGSLGPTRAVREPVDPSRYVIMRDADNAMVYQCALCSNRYVHRKSLNKHWNDKHSGRLSVESNVATRKSLSLFERIQLVDCGKDEMVNRRHSVAQFPLPPVAHCTSTLPRDDHRQSDISFVWQPVNSTIIPPAHRHSLPLDTFHLLSSPCPPISTPIARGIMSNFTPPYVAHSGGGRRLSDVASSADCVLDLSKNSQKTSPNDSHSGNNVDDRPLDFSFKSLSSPQVSPPNLPPKSVLWPPAVGAVLPTTDGSTFTFAGEDTTLVLPQAPEQASIQSKMEAKLLETLRKSMILAAHDSIAILRQMHHNATNFADMSTPTVTIPMPSSTSVAMATGVFTESTGVKPGSAIAKRPCRCMPDASNRTSKLKDCMRLATRDQTHEFFGGIAAFGQLRCRDCNFRATDMIGFSRHVIRHVGSSKTTLSERTGQNDENEQHSRGATRKNRFLAFLGLGLSKSSSKEEESFSCDGRDAGCVCTCHDVISNGGIEHVFSNESCDGKKIHQRASPLSGSSEMRNPAVQTSRVVNGVETESPGKMDPAKYRRPYPRGLGLTTTESTTAAGRSCRMRRLRHCERCSYVTDNLTTLRRHETKHGSTATHHCVLCDYAVNQLHTLNYHMRRVHGQQPDIIKSTRRRRKSIATNGFIPLDIKPDVSLPRNPVEPEKDTASADSSTNGPGVADSVAVMESCSLEKLEEVSHSPIVQNEVESNGNLTPIVHNNCEETSIPNQDPETVAKTSKKMRHGGAGIGARYRLLDSYGLRPGRGVCVKCGFRCLCAAAMKRHILTHADARQNCLNCSHRASTPRLLKAHFQRHDEDRKAVQPTHKEPPEPTNKEPQTRRRMYPCKHCPFQGASKDRLQRHEAFHGVRRQHVCGKCTYSIDRMNLIVLHRRLHTDATGSAQSTFVKAVKLPRRLRCGDCPYATCSAVALAVHRRGHRVAQRRFSCAVCSFGTDISNVYFQHKRLHRPAFVFRGSS